MILETVVVLNAISCNLLYANRYCKSSAHVDTARTGPKKETTWEIFRKETREIASDR